MHILIIILFVPFCIPLIILTMMSFFLRNQKKLTMAAEFLFPYSPFFWILPIITIPLLNSWYDSKNVGIFLTLIIPNIIFLFAYFPEFALLKYTLLRSLYNGLFAIIFTLTYWQFTVTPFNWGEGALAFVFIIPSLIGMVIYTTILLKRRVHDQYLVFRKKIYVGILLIFLILMVIERSHNYSNLESSSKIQMIQATTRYLTEHGTENFSQEKLIESGYLNGIYEIKNGIITNKYGGIVTTSKLDNNISIVYTQVPAKEPCFEMYNMNPPSIYGFEDIYISGVKVPKVISSTQKIEETKQLLCFSSTEPKIIEFRGNIQKIIDISSRQKTENSKHAVQITQNPQVAEKVLSKFLKLSSPNKESTDFEQWTYSMALYAAIDCWQNLNSENPIPKTLSKVILTKAGVWQQPSRLETTKLCQSIADNGFKPVCTNSFVFAKDVKRKFELPKDYLQIYDQDSLQIEGSLGCYLTPDQIGKQEYIGKIETTWIEKPRTQSFNLSNGPQELMAGTLMISVPNAPGLNGAMYKEPKVVIVIQK